MGNQDGASTCLGHQPSPLLRHGKGGRVLGLCWLSPCSLRCTFICPGLCGCVSARVYSRHSMHSIFPTCPRTRPTQGNAGQSVCGQTPKPTTLWSWCPWPPSAPSLGPLLPSGCPSLIPDVLRDVSWRDLNGTQHAVQGPEPCGITQLSAMGWTPATYVALPPTQQPDKKHHPIVEVQEPGLPEGDALLNVICAKSPSRAFVHISH